MEAISLDEIDGPSGNLFFGVLEDEANVAPGFCLSFGEELGCPKEHGHVSIVSTAMGDSWGLAEKGAFAGCTAFVHPKSVHISPQGDRLVCPFYFEIGPEAMNVLKSLNFKPQFPQEACDDL